jgi:hypothetical protein
MKKIKCILKLFYVINDIIFENQMFLVLDFLRQL